MIRLLPLLLLAACTPEGGQGTDIGNALQLVVAAEGLTIAEARDVSEITEAWMNVRQFELASCAGGTEIETYFEGPFSVDLLANEPLGEVELAFDTICEAEFYLDRAPVDSPPLVEDTSLYLEARSPLGNDVVVSSRRTEEFEVEEELTLQQALTQLSVLFDVDSWFEGVDVDSGDIDGGTIFIDDDRNPDLLDAFEENVRASARMTDDD